MKCFFVIRMIALAFFILASASTLKAQYNLGVEGGAMMTSLFSDKKTPLTLYGPKVGARGGLFVERELSNLFMIKTGTYYELKGANQVSNPPSSVWNLHYLSVPILLELRPVQSLILGLGIEGSALLAYDLPGFVPARFNIGARAEVSWQVSKAFRVTINGSIDFLPVKSVYFTDRQGQLFQGQTPTNFRHVTAGLSLAYIIKSFPKKQ